VTSNQTRKDWIVSRILNQHVKTVGIYRLIMKQGSDNYRQSAILDIMNQLQKAGIKVIVYETLITDIEDTFSLNNDLSSFKLQSEFIITNRWDDELNDVREKVYTRDLYKRD
jgi:UDPglucose 6-dehydrogenase